jgi:hypothetical protein
MRRLPLLASLTCALLGNGCMIRHYATLETAGSEYELIALNSTASGLLPGICGFFVGRVTEKEGVIQLHSHKEKYRANEFEIVDADGRVLDSEKLDDSYVVMDRKHRRLKICINLPEGKFDLNGRRSYHEDSYR